MRLLSILFIIFFPVLAHGQIIKTFAGNGATGLTGNGGPATAATLNMPVGVCMDAAGSVYFADYSNHVIRKVDPAGVISTFAGTGVAGYSGDGGPATAAQFNLPWNIAMDPFGNMFITEQQNNVIRKIDAAGIITTYAGTGAIGYTGDGGPATAATFYRPSDIAVDPTGNIYFGDGNEVIRMVSTAGIITTFAGTGSPGFSGDGGPALNAQFRNPISVEWGNGGLYIGDNLNNRIRFINSLGIINTIAGNGTAGYSGDGGPPLAARISGPLGLAVDASGDLYEADYTNNAVRKITSTTITTVAGTGIAGFSGDGGLATLARLNKPWGIEVRNGHVWFSDVTNNRVRDFGACVVTITGAAPICVGSSVTLSSSSTGTWTSSNTNIADVGVTTGVTTGISAGTAVITLSVSAGCYGTTSVTVLPPPSAITGTTTLCAGTTSQLSNSVAGGNWTSATPTVAIISSSGLVTGIGPGTSVVTYTTGAGCSTTTTVTILAAPDVITGATAICVGTTISLSNSTGGGTWSSSNNTIATVNTTTGAVTGLSGGTATISYILPSGCYSTTSVSVLPPPSVITGTTALCAGTTTQLSNSVTGGNWTSATPAVANISPGGVVTGVGPGTSVITYTTGAGCFTTTTVTVLPAPGTITGATALCVGTTISLSNSTGGGTWTSSNNTIATVNTATGAVTGLSGGTVTISYTLPSGCYAITLFTVSPIPPPISGVTTICAGVVTMLSNAAAGGIWSSATAAVATANGATGAVTGVAAGTAVISYTMPGGCFVTTTVNVNAAPSAISGTLSLCSGSATTLNNSVAGGLWISGNASIANISGSGLVTAVAAGTTVITYTLPGGCFSVATFTVIATPAAITGSTSVCTGNTISLGNTVAGGTWHTGTTGIAAVSSGGVVTGIAAGVATVTYSIQGCMVTTSILVNPTPRIVMDNQVELCDSSSRIIGSPQPPGAAYLWSTGSTDSAIAITQGTYTLTVTLNGCTDVATVNVLLQHLPDPMHLGEDTTVCEGTVVTLHSGVDNAIWNKATHGESYTVTEDGKYYAAVINACGSSSDTVNVFFQNCTIVFPTAFSPNGDGNNDIFRAITNSNAFSGYALSIYNRWGNRVFYTTRVHEGWDGKYYGVPQDPDVFYYMASYVFFGKQFLVKGDLFLVR